VRKEDLISRVWPDITVEESALRVHVAGLRRAFGDGKDGARFVKNVTGRGYRRVEFALSSLEPAARSGTQRPVPHRPAFRPFTSER
jgi:DNA-binding winged helix-turn-helix (wHTH) protein